MREELKTFLNDRLTDCALMESEHVGPFNLGNPGEFTMLELAEVCLPLKFHTIYK